MNSSPSIDQYILKHPLWQAELEYLRKIIQATDLKETIKWGAPVYALNNKNIVGLGAFKSYVGLWFFQGMYLTDTHNKLVNAQEGKTVAMRQWRFNHIKEINERLVKEYIDEAIENQKAGKEFKPTKKPLIIPEELGQLLASNVELGNKFAQLSLSCKREYAEYIAEAKRPETKIKRIEKIVPMILNGNGLNDNYR
jgi:uncharacterized protein YdeI (YjbR/CyaY-like superfamily)